MRRAVVASRDCFDSRVSGPVVGGGVSSRDRTVVGSMADSFMATLEELRPSEVLSDRIIIIRAMLSLGTSKQRVAEGIIWDCSDVTVRS